MGFGTGRADVDADSISDWADSELMAVPGLVPAEYTRTVSPAIWRISPAAIWDLPPFLTQTNSTDGVVGWFTIHPFTGRDAEFVEETADSFLDVVADRADGIDGLAGGVGQFPVLVSLAGEDGAGVAAAHGDDDVGGLHDLVGPGFGELAGDVDADFGHRLDRRRVDLVSGFRSAGPGDGILSGHVREVTQRHLGAARVVGAQEQDGGLAVDHLALDSGQGIKALAGEPLGQQRQEVRDGCAAGELVVGGVQEPFDRFDSEGAVEFALQTGGGCLQRDLLVDGQVATQVVGDGCVGHDELLCSVSSVVAALVR